MAGFATIWSITMYSEARMKSTGIDRMQGTRNRGVYPGRRRSTIVPAAISAKKIHSVYTTRVTSAT